MSHDEFSSILNSVMKSSSPGFIKTEPTSPSPDPTEEAPDDSEFDTYAEFEKSIEGDVIDAWKLGFAVYTHYLTGKPNLNAIVSKFVKKTAGVVQSSIFPTTIDLFDPTTSLVMSFANQILWQIPLAKATPYTESFFNVSKVTGDPSNVKTVRYYPSEDPFTGEPIDLRDLPLKNQLNHIALKNHLSILLRKSVNTLADIQKTWVLPTDKFSKDPNAVQFPRDLYDTLHEVFLEFYGISHDSLRNSIYSAASDIESLRGLPEPERKNKFKILTKARGAFDSNVFPKALKMALRDLKTAKPHHSIPDRVVFRSHKKLSKKPGSANDQNHDGPSSSKRSRISKRVDNDSDDSRGSMDS